MGMLDEEILTGQEALDAMLSVRDGWEIRWKDEVDELKKLRNHYVTFAWSSYRASLFIFYNTVDQELLSWFLKLANVSDETDVLSDEGAKNLCEKLGIHKYPLNVAYFELLW